ncbi:POZ domain-containing protein [Rhizophagus irregularis]|nr:POZ domain-containing protein [Rhizophagus irregularis]
MDSIKILLSDFRQIYEKPDDFDIVINVGKGENFKSFSAHSVILRARCPYFKKKKVITSEYYLENFSPEAFEFILKYIYTGECNIEEDIDMYQVLIASNELELTYLIDYAQNYIINNEEDWAENNIIRMYIESILDFQTKRQLNVQQNYTKAF